MKATALITLLRTTTVDQTFCYEIITIKPKQAPALIKGRINHFRNIWSMCKQITRSTTLLWMMMMVMVIVMVNMKTG